MYIKRLMQFLSASVLLLNINLIVAGELKIAVAANFTAAMKEIVADFEKQSGEQVLVSFGSTGKLYAQITHGAPFEVFLAADQRRPKLLQDQGMAEGRFTYAIGKLVLWSRNAGEALNEKSLGSGTFNKIAIANPKTAPYGAAAAEILKNLKLYEKLKGKLVRGENIAQTYQFVSTGNAELGFIALAQIALSDTGSRWTVPQNLYTPIRQDAVLLQKGKENPTAKALLDYLKSDKARQVIRKYGYGTDS